MLYVEQLFRTRNDQFRIYLIGSSEKKKLHAEQIFLKTTNHQTNIFQTRISFENQYIKTLLLPIKATYLTN